MNYPWTLLPGHKEDPPDPTNSNLTVEDVFQLPIYIANTEAPSAPNGMRGIPYCRGGDFPIERFEQFLSSLDSDNSLYTTGNIKKVSTRTSGTIGLDCGRFLSACFEIYPGHHPSELLAYGHIVSYNTPLQPMDMIIRPDYGYAHAMFYVDHTATSVTVYEVTSTIQDERTCERTYGCTLKDLEEDQGYFFVHPYYASGYTATQHWFGCETCPEYRSYENHTLTYTFTASTHTSTCEECDYTATENHTTGYRYDTAYHWTYCTDGCGYEVSARKRAHTMQYGACSVCGYNTNNLQTRPGTEVILQQ